MLSFCNPVGTSCASSWPRAFSVHSPLCTHAQWRGGLASELKELIIKLRKTATVIVHVRSEHDLLHESSVTPEEEGACFCLPMLLSNGVP